MKQTIIILIFVAISINRSAQQGGKSIDELIKEIFPGDGTTVDEKNPSIAPKNPDAGCVCVPYYLCKNDSRINTDGVGLIDIRIDDNAECASYLEFCCQPPDVKPEPITPKPIPKEESGCGYRNTDGVGFRITGDVEGEAKFGEFPWMTAVLKEEQMDGALLNVYQCGGALVHPKAVVTAAHCVSDRTKKFKVRAGEWDTQTKTEIFPHQDRDVKSVHVHPEYYAGALFNDYAVLVLDEPFDLTENVDVVCLPPSGTVVPEGTRCFASGWGKDVFGKEGRYQVILKRIDLPIVERGKCQDGLRTTRLGKYFQLHKSFVCAGGEKGRDTCKGDGGSPLVCPIPGTRNRYHQAGIVAWGIGCGEEGVPAVYANVAEGRAWIDQVIKGANLDTSSYTY